ncbi:MAG TPA: hypothetical protein VF794_12315 [Archangium sp.]|uniref:hypothetical protein n=1 Tax=Archangium sp. TaxID=1872627 RepID=UPI002EDB1B96
MRTYSFLSGRALTGLLTALFLAAAPMACRKPAQPSEAYAQARTRFTRIYAEKGDAAFVDPQMNEIDSLLAQVPESSLDAVSARELRARIQNGRQQAEAQARAQSEALAKAREPASMPSGFNSRPSGLPPPEEEEEAPVDSGTPSGAPQIGTSAAELAGGFSNCFQKGEQVDVRGRGLRDRWELQDRAACRQQYASLQDQVLIIEEGKVFALAPKSAIQVMPSDGGFPSDGGR